MQTLMDSGSFDVSAAAISDGVIRNRVVSPCGRFESFDCNGYHSVIDWNELDPPGADWEKGIPHEEVMEEMRLYCEELERQP